MREAKRAWLLTASMLAGATARAEPGQAQDQDSRPFDSEAWTADADQVRAVVADMLGDAQTRASLADTSATAGYAGGFFLAAPDGAFRVRIGGQLQFRYIANLRPDEPPGGADDFVSSFTTPRTRVFFDGHAFDPSLTFRVMIDANPATGNEFLQDAWVGHAFDENWQVRAGQVITQFQREWNMGDFKLFSVERSLQALIFGQFRSQFVDLKFQNDDVRVIGTWSDGFRSANTDLGASPADFGLTCRAEWKYAGEWRQLIDEYRSPRGSDYAGALGGAVHYERGPDTGAPGSTEQGLFAWTADLLTKGDGWNAMLAGVGYHAHDEAGAAGANFDDFGLLVQGGLHATEDLELIARYDIIFPDGSRAANDDFHTVTAGFNYYIHGQAAKFSFALTWLLDDTAGTTAGNFGGAGARTPANTNFGTLPSAGDNEAVVMAQFQLLF